MADLRPGAAAAAAAATRSAAAGQARLGMAVVDLMDQALVAVDRGWKVTHWNGAAEKLVHVSRNSVVGRQLWEIWPTLRGSELERTLAATMGDREPRSVRQWHDRERLGGRVLDVKASPLDDGGMVVLFRETSRQSRERDELATATEENTLLLELAGYLADTPDPTALLGVLCGIAMRECDADGAAICSVAGDQVEVLASIGEGVHEAGLRFPLANSTTAVAIASRRLARRPTAFATARTPGVATTAAELLFAPLIAHGQAMGVLAIARGEERRTFSGRDERRLRLLGDHVALAVWKSRLLEKALLASEVRHRFVATISHELRTPLTAITGYGELLADQILGPLSDGQLEMVERIRSVTAGLTSMVDELLTFSSLEARREMLRPAPVASGEMLRAAAASVEPVAVQKGLAVEIDIPDSAPSLMTDPEKLRQILVNLAGNAVKFTDAGSVRFTLESDRCQVTFAISDTGPGIPPGSQERIFQPFTQLDSGLTRRHGGTGLGLYLASRLAALLGGRIDVQSTPGVGSRFALVLPRS